MKKEKEGKTMKEIVSVFEKKVLSKKKFVEVCGRLIKRTYTQEDMEWIYSQFEPIINKAVDERYIQNISRYKVYTNTTIKFNRYIPNKAKERMEKSYACVKELKEHRTEAFFKILSIMLSDSVIDMKLYNIFKSEFWYDYVSKQEDFEMSHTNIIEYNTDETSESDIIYDDNEEMLKEKVLAHFEEGTLKEIIKLRFDGYNDSQIRKKLNIYRNLFSKYIKILEELKEDIKTIMYS